MNAQAGEKLSSYYREAGTWARDRAVAAERSVRLAWTLAAVAVVIAGLEALALAALAPLKSVVPYTLLVDRQTGSVTAVDPLKPEQISADAALTQSFLAQYVAARETFDITSLNGDYRKITSWSGGPARKSYIAGMQSSNPASPLNLYPRTSVVETRVKSISPLSENTALVRFDLLRRDAGAAEASSQPWVAVISYRWSNVPRSAEDRLINPLGFEVTRYRRNPEALPAVQAVHPSGRDAPAPGSVTAAPAPIGSAPR